MASLGLQSQAHRNLLDIIDRLRAQGISRYVDLPEIVVTGDQSAGKSSVLEAISGMTFPTKDNLCTRFATELILRRAPHAEVKVSITPDADRPEQEQEQLRLFGPKIDLSNPGLGNVIEEAKDAMGLNGPKKVFSNDILRVEMSGPEQPHLTMVDLPGLFQAGNSTQSDEDSELVTSMVLRYMARPRSIILAVVSAKSDFALQKVTRLARQLDPTGVRTLGLITKPDTLDEGSDSEAAYVQLAQNKDVKFRLGWHVLKNRDYKMRNATSAERDEAEADFFSRGAWTCVDPLHLGVASLRPRLSGVLKDQILVQLPSLLADVSDGIKSCRERLEKLGSPRGSIREQRRYLLHTSQKYSQLMQAAVDGVYNNGFFGSAKTDEGYRRRLRAVVQNTLMDFRDKMHREGCSRRIVDTRSKGGESNEILRSDYVREVKELIGRSRGCELPGTFNPLIVGELFADQCQPWYGMAMALKDDVLRAVSETSNAALYHVAVEDTAERLLQVTNSGIEDLKKGLCRSFEQVLEPYRTIHPITYNHYLTDNVQKAQAERRRRALESHLKVLNGRGVVNGNDALRLVDAKRLLDLMCEHDTELYGSTLAVDYMEAYYKASQALLLVALKTVVDAISTLAIECCLIQKLPSIFNAEKIHDMSDDEVCRLAGDDEASVRERAHHSEKLAVLETALDELRRLDNYRSVAAPWSRTGDASAKLPLAVAPERPGQRGDRQPSSSEASRPVSRADTFASEVEAAAAESEWSPSAEEPVPEDCEPPAAEEIYDVPCEEPAGEEVYDEPCKLVAVEEATPRLYLRDKAVEEDDGSCEAPAVEEAYSRPDFFGSTSSKRKKKEKQKRNDDAAGPPSFALWE